jgi:coenzyme F420-0:L-glutamate ligase
MAPPEIRIIGLTGMPEMKAGDDVAAQIINAARRRPGLLDGDVVVVTQKIVSKAEGRVVPLEGVTPSPEAERLALETEKDARLVELILRESNGIVRQRGPVLITETRHGFVCANAGVDASNVGPEGLVCLLPEDPDASARSIRQAIREATGAEVAVVISDTFGRPWREGHTNVAIGVAGMLLRRLRGPGRSPRLRLRSATRCRRRACRSGEPHGQLDGVPVASSAATLSHGEATHDRSSATAEGFVSLARPARSADGVSSA